MAIGALRRLVMLGARAPVGGPRWSAPTWDAWQVEAMIRAHRATYQDRDAVDPMPMAERVRALFLDDLGAHKRTTAAADSLLSLIDQRYANNPGELKIITTNAGVGADFWGGLLSEDSRAEPVVARLASRLKEGALLVPFGVVSGGSFTALRDEREFMGVK
jgi:hypothetical protein